MRRTLVDQLNEVSLADLIMVDVQHQPQMRAIHRGDQRQRVFSLRERRTGVINGCIEVLEAEGHALPLAELGNPIERVCIASATSPR